MCKNSVQDTSYQSSLKKKQMKSPTFNFYTWNHRLKNFTKKTSELDSFIGEFCSTFKEEIIAIIKTIPGHRRRSTLPDWFLKG